MIINKPNKAHLTFIEYQAHVTTINLFVFITGCVVVEIAGVIAVLALAAAAVTAFNVSIDVPERSELVIRPTNENSFQTFLVDKRGMNGEE